MTYTPKNLHVLFVHMSISTTLVLDKMDNLDTIFFSKTVFEFVFLSVARFPLIIHSLLQIPDKISLSPRVELVIT